jgi:hypothetical protein
LLTYRDRAGDLKSTEEPYLRTQEEMKAAYLSLTPDQQALLKRTADRVRAFAVAQKAAILPVQGMSLRFCCHCIASWLKSYLTCG